MRDEIMNTSVSRVLSAVLKIAGRLGEGKTMELLVPKLMRKIHLRIKQILMKCSKKSDQRSLILLELEAHLREHDNKQIPLQEENTKSHQDLRDRERPHHQEKDSDHLHLGLKIEGVPHQKEAMAEQEIWVHLDFQKGEEIIHQTEGDKCLQEEDTLHNEIILLNQTQPETQESQQYWGQTSMVWKSFDIFKLDLKLQSLIQKHGMRK